MAGISKSRIKEICKKNNIVDENLIKAISEIISENNEDDKGDGKPTYG